MFISVVFIMVLGNCGGEISLADKTADWCMGTHCNCVLTHTALLL